MSKIKELYNSINITEFNFIDCIFLSKIMPISDDMLLLHQYYKSNISIKEEPESIVEKVFGKKGAMRTDAFRVLQSRLYKNLIKACKLYIAYTNDDDNASLIIWLKNHHCIKNIKEQEKKIQAQQINLLSVDEQFLYKESQQHYAYSKYYNEIGLSHKTELIAHISSMNQYFDTAYALFKIKNVCSAINIKQQLNVELDSILNNAFLSDILNNKQISIIECYKWVYQFLHGDESAYNALFEYYFQHISDYNLEDKKDLFLYLQNFLIPKINSGNKQYIKQLFHLYKAAVEHELLINNNQLNVVSYNNITRIAIANNEMDWAEMFIKSQKKFLSENDREGAYLFNYANLLFSKKEYNDIQKLLRNANIDHPAYDVLFRVLLIKVYYETESLNLLDYLLQSFLPLLKRKKNINELVRANTLQFVKLVMRIEHINPRDTKTAKRVYDRINKSQTVEKRWLLDIMKRDFAINT